MANASAAAAIRASSCGVSTSLPGPGAPAARTNRSWPGVVMFEDPRDVALRHRERVRHPGRDVDEAAGADPDGRLVAGQADDLAVQDDEALLVRAMAVQRCRRAGRQYQLDDGIPLGRVTPVARTVTDVPRKERCSRSEASASMIGRRMMVVAEFM